MKNKRQSLKLHYGKIQQQKKQGYGGKCADKRYKI